MDKASLLVAEEVQKLTKYLINSKPDDETISRYSSAVNKLSCELNIREKKIWDLMIRFPFLIGPIDSALAFKDPEGTIRKRIFILLAILEASPAYTNYFLPKDRNYFYLVNIILSGTRAVISLITGIILLLFL